VSIIAKLEEEGSSLSLQAATIIKRLRKENKRLSDAFSYASSENVKLTHEYSEAIQGGFEKL